MHVAIVTLCVLTAFFSADALTAQQRSAILNYHNSLRSQLAKGQVTDKDGKLPAGKNIYKFVYNSTIEAITQANADLCKMEHSSSGFGENLYFSGGEETNLTKALIDGANSWWGEKDECQIKKDNLNVTTAVWDNCGHWIPMAWSHTTQLACGVQVCGPMDWCKGWCTKTTLVICNYYNPTDDSGNTLIYEKGTACTSNAQCTWYKNSTCDATTGLCVAPANQLLENR
uniref:SCP domain-containing protein n=1 Tax=Ditylenchus dipsaci TaxID=166011 RepID=A0A915DRU9_9BILA